MYCNYRKWFFAAMVLATILLQAACIGGGSQPRPTSAPQAVPASPTAAPLPPTATPLLPGRVPISAANADQVIQLAQLGKGSPRDIAFSPNGAVLAFASSVGIYLYDVETLKEIRFMQTDGEAVRVTFAPDGTILASAEYENGNIMHLWRVGDGALLRTLIGHYVQVWSVAFSPDGKLLASGSGDSTIKLWDVASGRELRTLSTHTGEVTSVTFSPDGKILASGSHDATIKLWEVATGRELRTLSTHTGDVMSVAFAPDGKTLASGSWDNTVKLWDVASGRELRTLRGHTEFVDSVAISPDGKMLASASRDGTIRLWEVATGHELRALSAYVRSVAFAPDGKTLASLSGDEIKLWEVETGRERWIMIEPTNSVLTVAFSPDGKILASGQEVFSPVPNIANILLWRVEDGTLLRTLTGHTEDVTSVAYSPDGKILASGSGDSTIKLWEVATRRELHTLRGHTGGVTSVAFSPDGKMLASLSRDATIKLWEVATGSELRTLSTHTGYVMSVAFSPDGETLASGGGLDGTLKLWEVATGRELRTLSTHTYSVSNVAFAPDGKILASPSGHEIELWEVATGRELRTLIAHTRDVTSVAFAPDGTILASAAYDYTIRLWRVTDGTLLRTLLVGHPSIVRSLAFSPDGTSLASGAEDQTVRLWGLATRTEAPSPTQTPPPSIISMSVTPTEQTIPAGASASFLVQLNGADWRDPILPELSVKGMPQGASATFSGISPFNPTLVIDASCSTLQGDYTLEIQAKGYKTIGSAKATLHIAGRLADSSPGSFTGSFLTNTIYLRRGGPSTLRYGPYLVLQFCDSIQPRKLRIVVQSGTSDAGTPLTKAPQFSLFRSREWPAPDFLQSNFGNVDEIARSDGWTLEGNITRGLYILVFHRYPGNGSAPEERAASVAYSVEIIRTPTPFATWSLVPATPTHRAAATPGATGLPVCSIRIASFARQRWSGSTAAQIGCPVAAEHTVNLVEQAFERGTMFWRDSERRIYVLFNDKTWSIFDDTWISGAPEDSCPNINVSQGLVKPKRGFGKVWCDQADVRAKIGAGRAGEFGPYPAFVQPFQRGQMFASVNSDQVFVLYTDGTWE